MTLRIVNRRNRQVFSLLGALTTLITDVSGIDSKWCRKSDWCRTIEMDWYHLNEETQAKLEQKGLYDDLWDDYGGYRWYYVSEWDDFSDEFQGKMEKLGWTKDKWLEMRKDGVCKYDRPLVELRPWSRLTEEEREIIDSMGLDEYSWHTKEFAMTAWQPEDGDIKVEDIPRIPAVEPPYFQEGSMPKKLTLNIPEFKKVTWEALRTTESDELLYVDDPEDKNTRSGNDEIINQFRMTMKEFVKGIDEGKAYYIKYEDDSQHVINAVLGDVSPVDILANHLEKTELRDLARLGKKYENEHSEKVAQLYVGGKTSITNMHLDIQGFNFLYVAAGRKRVRLLPNDQRYAKNFTWAYEAGYSVWTGYDLLNQPLPPGGVEIILEAGEGVSIPYLTWHAVENLEPSIAFGLVRDFHGTGSKKLCVAGETPRYKIGTDIYKELEDEDESKWGQISDFGDGEYEVKYEDGTKEIFKGKDGVEELKEFIEAAYYFNSWGDEF